MVAFLDAFSNLCSAQLPDGTAIEYLVDGFFRRVGKKVNGVLVRGFLYDSAGRVVAELNGSGNVLARFVYAERDTLPAYMVKGGVAYRILADHSGSPRLVVSSADGSIAQRLDYDSFGRVLQDTSPGFQPFGFAGGLYDRDTGLCRLGARDYDARVGRWLSKDPLLFRGGSFNLYAYVDNDPVNYRDPSGMEIGPDSDAYVPPPPPTRMERMKQGWKNFKRWAQDRIDDGFGWFGKKFNQWESCKNGEGGRSAADCLKLICSTPGIKGGAGTAGAAAADKMEEQADQNNGSWQQRDRDNQWIETH